MLQLIRTKKSHHKGHQQVWLTDGHFLCPSSLTNIGNSRAYVKQRRSPRTGAELVVISWSSPQRTCMQPSTASQPESNMQIPHCGDDNSNTDANVSSAVIMARPQREFTWFMQWMQTKCQAAANPQTKPTDLDCESICRLLSSTSTVAITQPKRCCYAFYHSTEGRRLSWPRWLVKYRDGLPAHRRTSVEVLTRPDVE